MKLKKIKNESEEYDIILEEENKKLVITFAGNMDLYWILIDKSKPREMCDFLITKENYRIYCAFDELVNRIKNHEVYSSEQLNNGLTKQSKSYPLYNNIVEWHSDDATYEDANILKIIKVDDDTYLIRIEFNKNNLFYKSSVCICNSGSRYNPYNIIFMNMFHNLQSYDVDDSRIHIEEYMYQKKIGKIK